MTAWPKSDANIILIAEIVLMGALLKMNAVDQVLQVRLDEAVFMGSGVSEHLSHYIKAGSYPVSQWITGFFNGYSTETLFIFERSIWWLHIAGILAFLNYVPYSKHFHIFLAFPNTWYANLDPIGKFDNMESVKKEVELMMDPSADPYAAPAPDADLTPVSFSNFSHSLAASL